MVAMTPTPTLSKPIQSAATPDGNGQPTLWGLTPAQLHDRFWAARGVQVLRQGGGEPIAQDAELYLLMDAHSLAIFPLGQLIDTLNWLKPDALFVRLRNACEHGYRERIITDSRNRFRRFEREYGGSDSRVTRVALTPNAQLAHLWQQSDGSSTQAWRDLRHHVGRNQRTTVSIDGNVYDPAYDREVMHFIRELVQVWSRPSTTVKRARSQMADVWVDADSSVGERTRFIGPVWIGAGRRLEGNESVVGPTVLWDDPAARPAVEPLKWHEIRPAPHRHKEPPRPVDRPIRPRSLSTLHKASKRLFDIVFATFALALTLPLYPLVMLAIWLEDGRPFFFAHRRETLGGVEFPCLKFRTMRKDAERMKDELRLHNQADGPQFYIKNDPRHTRVGRVVRKLNMDELPQFLNVLVGHMSVVGPRPSPHNENQYCPPWREARLSVRPGITGLWQVLRSREEGRDFQEWIRYDIEYVENMSWKLDLWIIGRTIAQIIKRLRA